MKKNLRCLSRVRLGSICRIDKRILYTQTYSYWFCYGGAYVEPSVELGRVSETDVVVVLDYLRRQMPRASDEAPDEMILVDKEFVWVIHPQFGKCVVSVRVLRKIDL